MKVYYHFEGTDVPFADTVLSNYYHKWKYRLMWELRHLENEISEDGGMIIIHEKKPNFRLSFHSQELVDKIRDILTSTDWDTW
jgi:hypothetical protein